MMNFGEAATLCQWLSLPICSDDGVGGTVEQRWFS
jgi:hypothetical protein